MSSRRLLIRPGRSRQHQQQTRGEVRDAVESALAELNAGRLRVAERVPGKTGRDAWTVINGSRRPCCSPSAWRIT